MGAKQALEGQTAVSKPDIFASISKLHLGRPKLSILMKVIELRNFLCFYPNKVTFERYLGKKLVEWNQGPLGSETPELTTEPPALSV